METLVAVMIMTGALIVIGSSWSSNLMRIEKARINSNMAILLERKMTEFDLLYRGKPLNEIKEEDSGEFEEDFPGYRWEMHSKEFVMPDLTSALSSASQQTQSSQVELLALIARTVTEYVQTTVKELTVTIYYKNKRKKTKEMSQSAATYLIDYTQPINVPGLSGLGGAMDGGAAKPSGGKSP